MEQITGMQYFFIIFSKSIRRFMLYLLKPFDRLLCYYKMYSNGVIFSNFTSNGIPLIDVSLGGKCVFGTNFKMNNRESTNPIGRFQHCSIVVGKKGFLCIGHNVGMSSTAIVCHEKIEIGNNVNFGGNVTIYDTDFHSLNATVRINKATDWIGAHCKPVYISDNVFIGAHSTILKGVTIGNNAIIGACSVVTKSVPSNEIWAGNPAKFIRNII